MGSKYKCIHITTTFEKSKEMRQTKRRDKTYMRMKEGRINPIPSVDHRNNAVHATSGVVSFSSLVNASGESNAIGQASVPAVRVNARPFAAANSLWHITLSTLVASMRTV